MQNLICLRDDCFVFMAMIGGFLAPLFGGFDKLFTALLICMICDYVTGIITALVFKRSPKTTTGAAQSRVGGIGLMKKIFMLILIVASNQIDIVLGTSGFVRNAAVIGFISNELLSLVENAGLMGLKLPPAFLNAIDILKKRSEKK
ncbi:phage holin family protein [Clostridium botulinum]|uniref:phage holin family protein n=1 Tax=Clostridium botulinum TaxID=1491 RepID=UPI00057E7EC9|nr:phage holin family protein [Clostridium botulinum]